MKCVINAIVLVAVLLMPEHISAQDVKVPKKSSMSADLFDGKTIGVVTKKNDSMLLKDVGIISLGDSWCISGTYTSKSDKPTAGKIKAIVPMSSIAQMWVFDEEADAELLIPPPKVANKHVDDNHIPRDVMNTRDFQIALEVDKKQKPAVKAISVYYSTDQGKTWVHYKDYKPNQESIRIKLDDDGEYSFSLRVKFADGSASPENLSGLTPSRIIVVDTEK